MNLIQPEEGFESQDNVSLGPGGPIPPEISEPRKRFNELLRLSPLSPEDKKKLLKPELLSQLSTEEYINLWKKLNPNFLSHISRQGFRDHYGIDEHTDNLYEYSNGLIQILGNQKSLRPPITVRDKLASRDELSIKFFLERTGILEALSSEEAKKRLNAQLNDSSGAAPNYADETAVHFAAQIIENVNYGGEENNEVFFVFPSDVLASQYSFSFNGDFNTFFTSPESSTKWNDVFVWPSDINNPNIPIDSGLLFLPEETLVDPKTGSKYAYYTQTIDGEERKVMKKNKNLISKFSVWINNLDENSEVVKLYLKIENADYYKNQALYNLYLSLLKKELLELGFPEDSLIKVSKNIFNNLRYILDPNSDFSSTEYAESIMGKTGSIWQRAENPISAKEYWEKYFQENPDQKPKHIIFYNGNPTNAVADFLERNGIKQTSSPSQNNELLGFDDNFITDKNTDPRANPGYNELIETAHQIIDNYYSGVPGRN